MSNFENFSPAVPGPEAPRRNHPFLIVKAKLVKVGELGSTFLGGGSREPHTPSLEKFLPLSNPPFLIDKRGVKFFRGRGYEAPGDPPKKVEPNSPTFTKPLNLQKSEFPLR